MIGGWKKTKAHVANPGPLDMEIQVGLGALFPRHKLPKTTGAMIEKRLIGDLVDKEERRARSVSNTLPRYSRMESQGGVSFQWAPATGLGLAAGLAPKFETC